MMRWLPLEDGSWGAALGLIIFLALFVGMLAWVFRPGAKREYERSAAMPLDDGAPQERDPARPA